MSAGGARQTLAVVDYAADILPAVFVRASSRARPRVDDDKSRIRPITPFVHDLFDGGMEHFGVSIWPEKIDALWQNF